MASTSPVPEGVVFVPIWAGENPALRAALLERLEAAGIPYVDRPVSEDPAIAGPDPLPIEPKPRFGFEVAVPPKDVEAAQALLDPLLALERQSLLELPAKDDQGEPAPAPACLEEAATVQIWSSDDPRLTQFLTDALRENEITTRIVPRGNIVTVYVPPGCEGRAREIVREVTQATPPE